MAHTFDDRIDLARRALDHGSALEALEHISSAGVWRWNTETGEMDWSDNLYRLYGYEPGELTPAAAGALERVHSADADRVQAGIERARAEGVAQLISYRVVLPDGAVRHIEVLQGGAHSEAGQRGLLGVVRDVTDERCTDRALAVHEAVADTLAARNVTDAPSALVVEALARAIDAPAAALWLPRGERLEPEAIWSDDSIPDGALARALAEIRLRNGAGLAGLACERGEPVVALPGEARHPASLVLPAGLRPAIAVPATDQERVRGVLVVYSPQPFETGARLQRALAGAGAQLGAYLARRPVRAPGAVLTGRELEVLQLAAEGLAGHEIEQRLGVSRSTVKSHFEHIYEKLGVTNRVAAVARALRDGLID